MSKISVITPIYNAEAYLEQSAQSALNLSEVLEVIFIEDGSKDGSMDIARQLKSQYPDKIVLLTHPNNENRGAGASRNLGIKHAKGAYIAFLDADDYYLEDRFKQAMKLFNRYPSLDYIVSPSMIDTTQEFKFVSESINRKDHDLFPALLTGKHGYFDTNSILIKTEALKKHNLKFNTHLRLHQDSELWLRISFYLKGYAENTTWPGSIVRRHPNNRITHKNNDSLTLYWTTVFNYFQDKNIAKPLFTFILLRKNYFQSLNNQSVLAYWYRLKIKLLDPKILKSVKP